MAVRQDGKSPGGRMDTGAARTALGRPWAGAFAKLERAAQAADDDGSEGLFAALL